MTETIPTELHTELVERCQQGDRTAYRELYDSFKNRIYSTAIRMLNDMQDAEEATQDVFVKVYKGIGNFRSDSALSTWIYRITATTCIDYMRKKKKFRSHVSIDDEETTVTLPPSNEKPGSARLILEQEIEKLPEEQKTIFVLHIVEGLKHKEIADILGITVAKSIALLANAKTYLRGSLQSYLEVLKNEM